MNRLYFAIIYVFFTLRNVRACRPTCKEEGFTSVKIADDKTNVIDLTYPFNASSAYWPNNKFGFSFTEEFATESTAPDSFYSTKSYESPEHLGTHLDAPVHFSFGSLGVHQVPFTSLMGHGVMIDMEKDGQRMNRSGLIEVGDLKAWEEKHDRKIKENDIVLLHTGYGRFYWDKKQYLGTNMTGDEAIPFLDFPGLDSNAATWLVEKKVSAVGIDTASIDFGQSKTFTTHRVLASKQIPILENVANLHKLIDNQDSLFVIALPMKIQSGTGAPLRLIAIT